MGLVAKTVGVDPVVTTLTDLYTVPAATQFSGHVIVANRGAATTLRIALSPAGAAIANGHYIAYDVAIAANDVYESPSFELTATDKVRVYAGIATLSFNLTGLEKT